MHSGYAGAYGSDCYKCIIFLVTGQNFESSILQRLAQCMKYRTDVAWIRDADAMLEKIPKEDESKVNRTLRLASAVRSLQEPSPRHLRQ